MGKTGDISPVDIEFIPDTPVFQPRIKKGKERWEVDIQKSESRLFIVILALVTVIQYGNAQTNAVLKIGAGRTRRLYG